MINEGIYKLKGKVLHYAWGGTRFLPELLGIPNPQQEPFAEYWMGAHPLAGSEIVTPGGDVPLAEWIAKDPDGSLSSAVRERFGELPYLFKVQDVNSILSIQVHPDKAGAEKGFAEEDARGVPVDAPHRNYKDRNHKPEMMVALSEFWLLHGFKSAEAIEKTLEDVPEFNILLPFFRREGLASLYRFVMEMAQPEINSMLYHLIKREIRRKNDGELDRTMPGWWIARLFAGKKEIGDIDRAVFSVYFFNIVKVNPGEGVFQGAGVPHAYMEGQCMELMANSDNVLRAGLTPKHIDVPELMKHTRFESIVPDIMTGTPAMPGERIYPCPVEDFGMARVELTAGRSYASTASSLEIFFIADGGVVVNNQLALKRGEAFVVFAGRAYEIVSSGNGTLYKAFVPQA